MLDKYLENMKRSNWFFTTVILFSLLLYYQLFLFGKIPFPGDLLVNAYSPWFDYFHFPTQNPIISDVFSQFYLWKMMSIESFKNGQWPLWNPYSFMGTPLLANFHSSVLYPFNILLLLSKFGWGLFIFSQTLIAGLAMYLLLGKWKLLPLTRLLGAIVFSISGLMTTWVELGTAVHTLAWLPLSIYCIITFYEQGKIRYLLMLSISLCLSTLIGNPQVVLLSYLATGFFLLYCQWNYKNYPKFLWCALFSGLGLLLASPQLLPSIDLLNNSIRSGESYSSDYNYGLLPLLEGIKFLSADAFGNPVTRNYWGFLNYSETSGFIGTFTVPLIVYAFIFLKKNKLVLCLSLFYCLTLLLAFDNPLSHYLYSFKIPLLTQSYASRLLFLTTFCSAILAAFSADQIIKNHDQPRFIKTLIWVLSGLCGIIIAFALLRFYIFPHLIAAIPPLIFDQFFKDDPFWKLTNYTILLKNITLPLVMILGAIIFYYFTRLLRKITSLQNIFMYFIIIMIMLDLSRYFLKYTPFVSADTVYPVTPAIQYLQQQPGLFRVGREHAEVLPPNTWSAYGLSSIEGYDPLYLKDYGQFMHFLNTGNLDGDSSRYAEYTGSYANSFLKATNTKYFIAVGRNREAVVPGEFVDYKFNEANYQRMYRDKSAVILENPNAGPRVFLAPKVQQVTDDQVKEIIKDSQFDPLKTVLLYQDLDISQVTAQGHVEVTNYTPNKVTISTTTTHDEVLVLADSYEKNWIATVDNQTTPISKANIIFRAIKVPAGQHTVIFEYWPQSFAWGLKIALMTFFGLIAVACYGYYKKIL